MANITGMVAAQAERIEGNLAYAASQKNNHGITEALGLWTTGLLFPELRSAERWRQKGKRLLEKEVARQIYVDGSYVQHSLNYHRMMLQALVWGARLGELNDDSLSPQLLESLKSATHFLYQMIDPRYGHAPNSGHNDGSLILPVSDCDYRDYRPALQAAHFMVARERLFPAGPWDEETYWLFGEQALRTAGARLRQRSSSFSEGGFYTLRGESGCGMMRCAKFKDRPAHADQLHLDMWWQGENILCDAGTYLYGGKGAWTNGLGQTAVHNTATVDGCPQMSNAGKFLWLDWAQANLTRRECEGTYEHLEAEHDGYRSRGVVHRRGVLRLGDDAWIIVDDLLGLGEHIARVQWLFPDAAYRLMQGNGLQLQSPVGTVKVQWWCNVPCNYDLVRSGEVINNSGEELDPYSSIRGWRSLYYAEKQPALSLSLYRREFLPMRFVTVITLGDTSHLTALNECGAELRTGAGRLCVGFGEIGKSRILSLEA
jgi:hypothetical protein